MMHRKCKLSSDSFDYQQYRKLRRGGEKDLEVIRKAFIQTEYTNNCKEKTLSLSLNCSKQIQTKNKGE